MSHRLMVWLGLVTSGFALLGLGRDVYADDTSPTTFTLSAVMELALERNPAVAGAQGLLKQSRGQVVAAGAYPNPSITGTAGRGAIRDPSTGVSIIERTVTVEQPLEWTAKRRARQQAAETGLAGAAAGLDETRLNLLADVKTAFYHLLLAQRDAELASQNLTIVEEVLRTVNLRVTAGEATSFEAMKATVEVQKAKKDVARAQNGLQVARTRLNTLTAGGLGKHFAIQGDFQPPREPLDIEGLIARALDQHPTLRRLTKQSEQAAYSVALERESRIPNIVVQGQYHREAGDESVTAGLSVPLPLWYRRQGEIESALGAKYRAEAERLRARNDLEQAITQYVQEAQTATEQIHVFETGLLKQAERTLEIARSSFRQGAASLLDLLDSQRSFRQTQLEYAQARAELSIALSHLERAVGGPL
ncbi:MAG: TolC family protein [Gaiellales bacterium]|nr:MAG: TolC family protein [Gaiellales bacterium]